MRSAPLITFEGLDGCGKSTQIELLKEYFSKQGIDHIVRREPGGTNLGEQIRSLLLHGEDMSSLSELYLFNASRAQMVEEVIRPHLAQGVTVVMDRFYDSTSAYQGFARYQQQQPHWGLIQRMNESFDMVPDVTFYLSISLEERLQRLNSRKGERDRMESQNDSFHALVKQGYDELARMHSDRIVTLDGSLPVQVIHEEYIVSCVEKKHKNF
ncbi:MAG: dTMP kinase [Candidatus Woesearchaeota archaeon]